MKSILMIFLLTLAFNCLGQVESFLLIEQTAKKIGIKNSDIFFQSSVLQDFENHILIVIPEIAEVGEGYMILNSNIILIDKKAGAIEAVYKGEKAWYSDAVRIDQIEIEPTIYQLNKTNVAFGLKVFYANQSRPNPTSSIELSLFAFDGEKLNPVLKDFPISQYYGETDTTCKGTFKIHTKELEVSNIYTNKYADLEFINLTELYELDEDCEKTFIESIKKIETLKFKDNQYTSNQ